MPIFELAWVKIQPQFFGKQAFRSGTIYKNTENVNRRIISEVHNLLNWMKQIPSIRKQVSNAQKHAAKTQKQKLATSKSFSAIEYIDEFLKNFCTTSDNENRDQKNKAFSAFQTITRRLCFS